MRSNGSIVGKLNEPSMGLASGVWDLATAFREHKAGNWPSESEDDPYFSSVSLLLHFNGTDASTTFTDSSPNAFTVTANGDAQIDTDQSKFGGASGLFDGAGGYLSVASDVDFEFGTGDFTIECFIRCSVFSGDFFFISSTGTDGLFFGILSGTSIGIGSTGTSWDTTATHGMSLDTWYHVAVTRSGSTVRLFVAGSVVGSGTNATAYDLGLTEMTIGSQGAGYYYNGHIDELRVTKGVARYTAGFTPPTAPFSDF